MNDGVVGNPNVYYPFDSTAVDATGGGQDATLQSGSAYFTEVPITAVTLDGVDDHVSMPEGIISSLEDFTICAWVYVNENREWGSIFDFVASTAVDMYLISSAGNTNKMRFTIRDAETRHDVMAEKEFPTATWTHVAVTYHGTSGTLYMNGLSVGSSSGVEISPGDLGLTTQNYIGRSLWSSDPYLYGML